MHTYRIFDGYYTVGYWLTDDDGWDWNPLKNFAREYDAAAYASFLNGGNVTPMDAARFTEMAHRSENEEA